MIPRTLSDDMDCADCHIDRMTPWPTAYPLAGSWPSQEERAADGWVHCPGCDRPLRMASSPAITVQDQIDVGPLIDTLRAMKGSFRLKWTNEDPCWRLTVELPPFPHAERLTAQIVSFTDTACAVTIHQALALLTHLSDTDRLIHEKLMEK